MSDFNEVFSKVDTVCVVCGTPLGGPNDRCIGGDFYCADDYTRKLEENRTARKLNNNKKFSKIFKGFGGEL